MNDYQQKLVKPNQTNALEVQDPTSSNGFLGFFRYIPMGKVWSNWISWEEFLPSSFQTTFPSLKRSSRLRGARANLTRYWSTTMPHNSMWNMVDGYSLSQLKHLRIIFCWILLRFEFYTCYKTMPICDHLMHFQPKEEKHTEMSTKMTDGQTAFLWGALMGHAILPSGSGCGNQPTQILKFGVDSGKKPALEVLRCRYLSLNDEWICMNYWLMYLAGSFLLVADT